VGFLCEVSNCRRFEKRTIIAYRAKKIGQSSQDLDGMEFLAVPSLPLTSDKFAGHGCVRWDP